MHTEEDRTGKTWINGMPNWFKIYSQGGAIALLAIMLPTILTIFIWMGWTTMGSLLTDRKEEVQMLREKLDRYHADFLKEAQAQRNYDETQRQRTNEKIRTLTDKVAALEIHFQARSRDNVEVNKK